MLSLLSSFCYSITNQLFTIFCDQLEVIRKSLSVKLGYDCWNFISDFPQIPASAWVSIIDMAFNPMYMYRARKTKVLTCISYFTHTTRNMPQECWSQKMKFPFSDGYCWFCWPFMSTEDHCQTNCCFWVHISCLGRILSLLVNICMFLAIIIKMCDTLEYLL